MSAYVVLQTPMTDLECLVDALVDAGFRREHVEVHPSPVPLVGYMAWSGQVHANVVIRRRYVGASSNDIGFEQTPTGYRAHINDDDLGRYGNGWLRQLSEHYEARYEAKQRAAEQAERERLERERRRLVEAQRASVHAQAKKLGYRVEETREHGKVRMVLVKRVY